MHKEEGKDLEKENDYFEVNADGLVGPTHNYAALAWGNLASLTHGKQKSYPQQAALQGLKKMWELVRLGLPQIVLPPQDRPHLKTLRAFGFQGDDTTVIDQAAEKAPDIFFACYSASSMWMANAATISPSLDTRDGKVHITPANLATHLHRSIEVAQTAHVLKQVFLEPTFFTHHPPLFGGAAMGDEGAANHTRLCPRHGQPGIHLFVYGRDGIRHTGSGPTRFVARQTRQASETIARLHQLPPERCLLVQQNPQAIDQGVFHNDVIATGNESFFLYHSQAFLERDKEIARLQHFYSKQCGGELLCQEVPEEVCTIEEAVKCYLFNSQIVTVENGAMYLIAPEEVKQNQCVKAFIDEKIASANSPLAGVYYFDLTQSMQNGGGPACLRLRVPLSSQEKAAVVPGVWLTEQKYDALVKWVLRHFRETLEPNDLRDPFLLEETRVALDELTSLLGLGSLYDFQQEASSPVSREEIQLSV